MLFRSLKISRRSATVRAVSSYIRVGAFDWGTLGTRTITVDGFDLKGSEPVGTARRIAFHVDGKWGILTPEGTFRELSEQSVSAESVLFEGNTVQELLDVASIPAFVGKQVGVAVGLSAPGPDSIFPTFGMSLICKTPDPITSRTVLSDMYEPH